MELKELKEREEELYNLYETGLRKLRIDFCNKNNPYKIGDIITDHHQTIKIESIGYSLYNHPSCVYRGAVLKKDLTETKRKLKSTMYQHNILNK